MKDKDIRYKVVVDEDEMFFTNYFDAIRFATGCLEEEGASAQFDFRRFELGVDTP